MTARELIEALSKMPPDAPVVTRAYYDAWEVAGLQLLTCDGDIDRIYVYETDASARRYGADGSRKAVVLESGRDSASVSFCSKE